MNERTICFMLILDNDEFQEMLGYEMPRTGEHLAIDGALYRVNTVTRQYMNMFDGSYQETRAAVEISKLPR